MPHERVTLVMVAEVPAAGVAAFQEYEARVLPLLARHGGVLERRLRSADALVEVHLVSFGSRDGFDAYVADEERRGHRALIEGIGLVQRLVEVQDVQAPDR